MTAAANMSIQKCRCGHHDLAHDPDGACRVWFYDESEDRLRACPCEEYDGD